MTTKYVLLLDDPKAELDVVGGKGASLARLTRAGMPVPGGFHVTTEAYRQFVVENDMQPRILATLEAVDTSRPATLEAASQAIGAIFSQGKMPEEIAGAIAQAYASLPGDDPAVAVRSSATAEDLPDLSFAGQQETFLNVRGVGDVLGAVKRCWASLWTARAIGYRMQHDIDQDVVSLAVVVQMLVPAEAAGILFTANPINGRRSEVVISAAWGLGEAVVGGLVTPDSLTIEKVTGRVLERQTADKQVMTVRVEGGTEEQPVPDDLRAAPVLSDQQAADLVYLSVQIEDLYGMPMDIEWTLRDGKFAVVQARPVTALPPEAPLTEPEVVPPSEWLLPDPKGQYMRGSVADFMPDPLTPLFASLGIPAFNAAVRRVMLEIVGSSPDFIESYTTTINDYAYMYINLKPRDLGWVLFRMLPAVPRMARNALRHWREQARPRYIEAVAEWQEAQFQELTSSELLAGVRQLLAEAAYHVASLQIDTLGIAAGTEGLFTAVYERLIKRPGDPSAPIYLLGFESKPILAEKELYDLAQWCRERDGLAAHLLDNPSAALADQLNWDESPTDVDAEVWREWQHRFRAHLEQYGHSIYSLDFAQPLPSDSPGALLETLKMFIRGQGSDPHARQKEAAERREQAIQAVLGRTKGLKGGIFRKTLGWAQDFGVAREDSIAEMGLGYPVMRRMLHELGRRLAEAGAIAQAEDLFWLDGDEIERAVGALDRSASLESLGERVRERKGIWQGYKRLTPPVQLPPKERVMGIKMDAFLPVDADEQVGASIKGIGVSPGQVTAAARVLFGPEEFDQMRPGEILVAEITTPAWTPLFAMASGVVTDIGGPLSHGSIVAREYGIPAVLGTGIATRRIQSGQMITVDGSVGTVTLS